MSSYVQKVLQPGETVTYKGSIHWLVYLPALILAALSLAGFAAQTALGYDGTRLPASIAIGFGLLLAVVNFLRGWFRRYTTEVAVTDRRIILKHGFISRQTVEMNMTKVESVDVSQSILGRIFDYGDILVRGTGSGLEPMHMIARPLEFRNAVIAH